VSESIRRTGQEGYTCRLCRRSHSRDRRLESTCHCRIFFSTPHLYSCACVRACVRAFAHRSFRADVPLSLPLAATRKLAVCAYTRALAYLRIRAAFSRAERDVRAGGVTLRNAQGRRQEGVLVERRERTRERERERGREKERKREAQGPRSRARIDRPRPRDFHDPSPWPPGHRPKIVSRDVRANRTLTREVARRPGLSAMPVLVGPLNDDILGLGKELFFFPLRRSLARRTHFPVSRGTLDGSSNIWFSRK